MQPSPESRKRTTTQRRDEDLDKWARFAPELIRHRVELIGIARTFHDLGWTDLGIRTTKLRFRVEDMLMELSSRADAVGRHRLP